MSSSEDGQHINLLYLTRENCYGFMYYFRIVAIYYCFNPSENTLYEDNLYSFSSLLFGVYIE